MLGVLFYLQVDVAVSAESVVGVSVLSGADPVSHTCTVALLGAVVLEVSLDIRGCLHMLMLVFDSVGDALCLSSRYERLELVRQCGCAPGSVESRTCSLVFFHCYCSLYLKSLV